jgi:hypothetical protein
MLVQRVDSGEIHVSRHATWGMSAYEVNAIGFDEVAETETISNRG